MPASPRYPNRTPTTLQIAFSVIARRPRSFRQDSHAFLDRLRPPLRLIGKIPPRPAAGRLVLANHFRSPSFRAWWIPFALTAALDEDIHWVMANAWTYPDPLRSHLVTPLTRALFRRVGRTYSFTLMPPMPPAPHEAAARARAVRQVLHYAATRPRPQIGLVPEGGDSPQGDLAVLPPGAGRFISHLAGRGLELLPAGVFEEDGFLCLRFGEPIDGPFETRTDPETRDRLAANRVMMAIAACLPERLRGPYSRGVSSHASA